jgi:hypothetical protein
MGHLDKAFAQGLAEDRFEAMISLLKPLILSFDPNKTVFVIIDNASGFEGVTWKEWRDQMLQTFNTLHCIVKLQHGTDSRMQLKVKLLMTNANKPTTLRRLVEDKDIISLWGGVAQSVYITAATYPSVSFEQWKHNFGAPWSVLILTVPCELIECRHGEAILMEAMPR